MITAVEPDLLRRQTPSACILPAFSTSSQRLGILIKPAQRDLPHGPSDAAESFSSLDMHGKLRRHCKYCRGWRRAAGIASTAKASIASCRVCPGPEPLVRPGSSNGRLPIDYTGVRSNPTSCCLYLARPASAQQAIRTPPMSSAGDRRCLSSLVYAACCSTSRAAAPPRVPLPSGVARCSP